MALFPFVKGTVPKMQSRHVRIVPFKSLAFRNADDRKELIGMRIF
jgi:hypothetical protein